MRPVLLPVLVALLALPACRTLRPSSSEPTEAVASTRAASSANAQKWRAANVRAYTFTYERQCFCTAEVRGPFVVTVENGAVASVRRLAGGMTPDGTPAPGAEDRRPENRLRVEDFFALLDGAFAENAAEVRVAYDRRLGFPTSVWIDRDRQMADEEVGYRLTDLRRR